MKNYENQHLIGLWLNEQLPAISQHKQKTKETKPTRQLQQAEDLVKLS